MTHSALIQQIQSGFMKKDLPTITTGMEVEVYQIIKEGEKSRIQKFKGLVIKVAGKGEMEKTITVRRKVGAFGVEKIFAIHSPTIEKIEVIRKFKVRRKSIKFIRDLTGKAARLKEVRVDIATLNTPREITLPTAKSSVEKPKVASEIKPDNQSETKSQETQEVTPETLPSSASNDTTTDISDKK